VDLFLGCYLTEPKPHVFFVPPPRPLTARSFAAASARRGVHLDPRTLLLYDEHRIFINGAAVTRPRIGARAIEQLANARAIRAREPVAAPAQLFYQWYRDGYLHLG
jgi:50S ribosomal protein L16 3-hydroxylase